MKRFVVVLSAVLLSTSGFGQDTKLPDVLRPDANSIAAAEQSGVGVFKLLPRGTFKSESYKDEDNPIGIREGGSFYSFTTGAHSYNKVPQIMYEDGNLSVGFAGADYGFIRDLGTGSLTDISLDVGLPKFLIDYRPPLLRDEIRKEQRRSHNYETDGDVFTRRVPAVVGHIYALRSISFRRADILVAFQIQKIEQNGSLTITWKRIREFDVPKLLDQTDEAMRAKVEAVLSDPRYTNITALVKDNRVTLSGTVTITVGELEELLRAIKDKADPSAIDNRIMVKRPSK